MKYFGFAISDSMFPAACTLIKRTLTAEEARAEVAAGVVSCCNPSHKPTIAAMRSRFGLDVEAPEKAPVVALDSGDTMIVMSVRGLPRLEGRHEYTNTEIEGAAFSFSRYEVGECGR